MTRFDFPLTLSPAISDWLYDTGITGAVHYCRESDEGNHHVIFERDTDAMMFKMRWHEAIADEIERLKDAYGYTVPVAWGQAMVQAMVDDLKQKQREALKAAFVKVHRQLSEAGVKTQFHGGPPPSRRKYW